MNRASDAASLPAARRAELLEHIRARRQASVPELAREFSVSRDTIRRDLDYLDSQGLVIRTHGGAIPNQTGAALTEPFDRRSEHKADAKARIGRLAASLVQDDETVLVGGGTTTLATGIALTDRTGLTIVTNHLLLPANLPRECYRMIYIVGGQYRPESLSTYGRLELPGIRGISADRAIVGCSGITTDGISVAAAEDASILSDMLQAARHRIVVADSTKLNRSAFAHAASWSELDTFVTDTEPDSAIRGALTESGVELYVAGEVT